jgi:hypothetical protein
LFNSPTQKTAARAEQNYEQAFHPVPTLSRQSDPHGR